MIELIGAILLLILVVLLVRFLVKVTGIKVDQDLVNILAIIIAIAVLVVFFGFNLP